MEENAAAAAGKHFVLAANDCIELERPWHHSAIVKTISLWGVLEY